MPHTNPENADPRVHFSPQEDHDIGDELAAYVAARLTLADQPDAPPCAECITDALFSGVRAHVAATLLACIGPREAPVPTEAMPYLAATNFQGMLNAVQRFEEAANALAPAIREIQTRLGANLDNGVWADDPMYKAAQRVNAQESPDLFNELLALILRGSRP